MKVLFVGSDPKMFEENSLVRARLREQARAIGELHVLSNARPGTQKVEEENLTLYPVPGGLFRFFRLKHLAQKIIREKNIEVVSAQDPFEHGRIGDLARRGTRAHLQLQLHTDALSPYFKKTSFKNRVRIWLMGHTLPKAQGIRVVSERVRRSLVTRYGDKITNPIVIPVATTRDLPAKAPFPKHPFSFVLFATSRLEPEKRIKDLLDALVIVREKYPHTGLFIAGDGSEKQTLMRYAASSGLSDSVMFLGWRTDAWALMQSANVFVESSAYEGYGLTLLEAALAHVPIVSTDVGIVGEVLKPEEGVLIANVGDVSALAVRILRLIEQNDLRSRLTEDAYAAATEHLAATGDIARRIADAIVSTYV